MAFSVKILNLDKVLKKIEDLITKDLDDSKLLENIKDFSVLRIQAETRRGKDLTGGDGEKQLALKPSTIRIRQKVKDGDWDVKKYGRFIPDPDFFVVNKSNLTSTGQMLDSLEGTITKQDRSIIVKPTGSRDPNLSYSKDFATNIALAKDLASRGRTFLGLDLVGIKRIRKMILDEIRRLKKSRGFK